MMANSARDPYWQAGVRRETIDHPTHSAAIQDECAGCHMPMAHADRARVGRQGRSVRAPADQPARRRRRCSALAADGVSCTVCHQIATERLGTRESFNGEFVIEADAGRRRARDLRAVSRSTRDARPIMRSVTGFVQAEAPHIKQSELCATCHTLITQAFGPNGEVIGSLPEQMNYQEWQHSDFNREAAQLPVVPHADGRRADSRGIGARRRARQRWPATSSSAATPTWCGCSTAIAPSSASRRSPAELEATANGHRPAAAAATPRR